MKPYVIARRGGWVAYSSVWAYLFGREHILRARTWEAMSVALAGLRKRKGAPAAEPSAPSVNSVVGERIPQ